MYGFIRLFVIISYFFNFCYISIYSFNDKTAVKEDRISELPGELKSHIILQMIDNQSFYQSIKTILTLTSISANFRNLFLNNTFFVNYLANKYRINQEDIAILLNFDNEEYKLKKEYLELLSKKDIKERENLIFNAIKNNNVSLLMCYLKFNIFVDDNSYSRNSVFYSKNISVNQLIEAIMEGYSKDLIELIINYYNIDINAQYISNDKSEDYYQFEGNTPLHAAVSSKNKGLVKFLIEIGADINFKDNFDKTPIMKAVFSGDKEMVLLLLNYSPDLSNVLLELLKGLEHKLLCIKRCSFSNKFSAMDIENFAFYPSNQEEIEREKTKALYNNIFDILLKYINIKQQDEAIIELLKHDYWWYLKNLFDKDINNSLVNTCDKEGNSLLMIAIRLRKQYMVKFLLNYDADITLENINGKTALDIAIESKDDKIISILLEVQHKKLRASSL